MWSASKSSLIVLPSDCKKLILLNALFQGGRLFVGAVGVLYFLSFGLQPGDYACVKTAQAIIFIGLDIPLGYFLSRMGEYRSLQLSIFFGLTGAFGYLAFTSFLGFLISEIFLALSLSIWPVSLSAYSMRVLSNYKIEGLTEKFFHFGDAISNLFVIFCGTLGGFLYAFNKYIPYEAFLFFYIFAGLCSLFLKDFEIVKQKKSRKLNFILSNIKEMRPILRVIPILFFCQFLMQPLFHYWQPLFKEKFSTDTNEMSIIFIGYSIAMSTMSWGYSRVTHIPTLRSDLFIIVAAIIGSLFYNLIVEIDHFGPSLLFFALSFGIFNLVQVGGGVLIQNRLSQENRMIITKYISFFSRMGMIISLIVLNFLYTNGWKTSDIYKLYGGLAILVFFLYLGWMIVQKTVRIKYVFESTS
jgi:MFS family permease